MDAIEKARKSVEKDSKKMSNKTKEKVIYISHAENVCDLVLTDGKVKFLTIDGELLDEIIIDDQKHLPPSQDDLDYLLSDAKKVTVEAKKHQISDLADDADDARGCAECLRLYNDLVDYHKKISELPNSKYYDLLALWDFHTYLIEKFDFSPIIYLFADRERGKTRTAKGLIFVSRRGIMTETLREANLIRWGRDHKATLLFDVKNF